MAASFSPAGTALGFGRSGADYSDALGSGVPAESEEEKKKRLAQIAQAQNRISGTLSPAGAALFGSANSYSGL
jgi:hypothetical protein